jgi:hypothetical protein
MSRRCALSLALVVLAAGPLAASTGAGRTNPSNALAASATLREYEARYGAAYALHTPSYARQTGLACSACHTHYPELTAMGRQFKLNGYVFRRGSDSLQGRSAGGQQNMLLGLVTPLSFMLQTSYTATSKAQPGTQNGTVFFPDQLSIFTGGEITPHVGGFLQITFDPQSGSLGVDNADFRFANHTVAFGRPTIYGLSLNNNPTVQDVWNSTPAWGFPYASSSAAPAPASATLIDGSLGGQVAGLTAYTMWGEHLYLEAGAYRAAPLGIQRPLLLDAAAEGQIQGFAPYWRVAVPMNFGQHYLSVGAYGMSARQFPGDFTLPTTRTTDVALDVSYMVPVGNNSFTVDGTWIHESQHNRPGALNVDNTLKTLRFAAMFHVGQRWAFTLAPFSTTGTVDAGLYAPDPTSINGSRTGSPASSGVIAEADLMPWQNLRLQAQYVAYSKFNGASSNYDNGRNAADNNTLYLITWLLF